MSFDEDDVDAGVKLSRGIYLDWTMEEAIGTKERNLVLEIRSFETLLLNLNTSIQSAYDRYSRIAVPSSGAYNPIAEDFQAERRRFIGDIEATLKECRKFLETRKKLSRKDNTIDGIDQLLSTADQIIDDLRYRIHMHSTKVKFAIDRLSINQITDIDSKVNELVDISNRHIQLTRHVRNELHLFKVQFLGGHAGREPLPQLLQHDIHIATPSIRARFNNNLSRYAPATFDGEIPLAEGFDILLTYFEQSITDYDQTPTKYLTLLKTRWILEKIQESKAFLRACPGFYYKRATNQIELFIKTHIRNSSLIAFEEHELLDLPQEEFLIWPPPRNRPLAPVLTAAIDGEAEVTRVPIIQDTRLEPFTLTVFRQSETGILRIFWDAINSGGQSIIQNLTINTESDAQSTIHNLTANTKSDGLIPRYAFSNIVERRPEIGISSRGEEHLFVFPSHKELLQFQTAITGYEVAHEQDNIVCQFSKSAIDLDCQSTIQIWQDPISPGSLSRNIGVTSHGGSSEWISANASIKVSNTGPEELTRFKNTDSTIQGIQDRQEADNVSLSALVIFRQGTWEDTPFVISYIALDKDFMIDPKGCNCWRSYNECAFICIKRKRSKSILIQTLSSAYSDSRGSHRRDWLNLLSFHQIDRQSIQIKKSEYLQLRFSSLKKKKEFHNELNRRFRLIDLQYEQIRHAQRESQSRKFQMVPKSVDNEAKKPVHQSALSTVEKSNTDPPTAASIDKSQSVSKSMTSKANESMRLSASSTAGKSLIEPHVAARIDRSQMVSKDMDSKSHKPIHRSTSSFTEEPNAARIEKSQTVLKDVDSKANEPIRQSTTSIIDNSLNELPNTVGIESLWQTSIEPRAEVLKDLFDNAARLFRPRLKAGYRRLEWRCTCGELLYSDFKEENSGSIDKLAARLRAQAGQEPQPSTPSSLKPFPTVQDRTSTRPVGWNLPSGQDANDSHALRNFTKQNDSSLPSHKSRTLQLCIESGKFTLELGELELASYESDGVLFEKIRQRYESVRRSILPMKLRFTRPEKVIFIKFRMAKRPLVSHISGTVDQPSIPSKEDVSTGRYDYVPCPMEEPPMDSRIFLHHFYSPASKHPDSLWAMRLPWRLEPSPAVMSTGWGIHLEEHPDWSLFAALMCILLLISGITAGIYSWKTGDTQTGISIGAWLTTVQALGVTAVFFWWV